MKSKLLGKRSLTITAKTTIEEFKDYLDLTTVKGFLNQQEKFLTELLEDYLDDRLPVEEPIKLLVFKMDEVTLDYYRKKTGDMSPDTNLRDASWPDHIHLAAEAWFHLQQVKKHMTGQDMENALFHAFEMMSCFIEFNIVKFEDDILLGRMQRQGRKKGGRVTAEKNKEQSTINNKERLRCYDALLKDGYTNREACRIVAERAGVTVERISQIVRKRKKQKTSDAC